MGAGARPPRVAAGLPTRAALAEQLHGLVTSRLLDPLEILLGPDAAIDHLQRQGREHAEAWAARLLADDERAAVATVARLLAALYPGDRPFVPPAAWWQTPLGQVVVRRAGHPATDMVSYPVAGAMLGVTRQGVHDLATRGKLTRHPDGGVTVASVRARLHQLDREP